MADLARIVCARFGIDKRALFSRRRIRRVCVPRFLFCLLAREIAGRSYPEIAMFLGGRHHTSIMHAVCQAKEMIAADEEIAGAYLRLLQRMRTRVVTLVASVATGETYTHYVEVAA